MYICDIIINKVRIERMQKEFLDSFEGKKNVWHIISDNGNECWLTQEVSFADETCARGACKLNTVVTDTKHVLFLFNNKDEEVGRYYIGKKLQGKTPGQITELKDQVCFFESWNPSTKSWVPCIGFSSKERSKRGICKEGCDRITIFRDGYYSVIDKQGNIIVPPGRYNYIDGFDHNLARVKIAGMTSINNPKESTKDKWGIIDTSGTEILPVVYTEIWNFYGKNLKRTKVWEGGKQTYMSEGVFETIYSEKVYRYDFYLDNRELVLKEDWSNGEFDLCDPDYNSDNSYDIMDALDGEIEAAGNIDYEW